MRVPRMKIKICDRYVTSALTELPGIRIFFGLLSALSLTVCLWLVLGGNALMELENWVWPGLSLSLAIAGMVGVTVEDVHSRRQMNRQRVDSEEKYRNLFHYCNDAIILHDLRGRIVDANEKAFHLFGFSRPDFLRLSISDLHPQEAQETSRRAFSTVEKDRFVQFEILFQRQNGDLFLAEVSSSMFEADGRKIIQGIVRDITERKMNEEMLRDIQARYQALYDRTLYGVYVHDFNGMFLDANDAALNMVGYKREEIPQIHLSTLLDETQLSRAHREIETLIRHGREKRAVEYTLRRKDGSLLFVETESCIIYRHGKPFAVQGVVNDITRRRQIMEALQAAEQRFRTLFEDAVIGLYRTTPDGKLLMANPTFVRMLGCASFEELAQRNLEKDGFEPRYKRAAFRERIEREGQIVGLESTWTRRDGKEIYVRENARCTRDGAGKVLYYEGTVEDITERRRAEISLRESEAKYRTLTENLNIGIYRNTPGSEGKFIEANQAIIRMFGHEDKEDFLRVPVADLYFHPKEREEFSEKLSREGCVREESIRLKKRDGTHFWGAVTAVAVCNDKGQVTYYDGVIEDITERKRAEDRLRRSEERYRQLYECLRDASATVNMNGKIVECNSVMCQMLGYSREELYARSYEDITLKKWHDVEAKILSEQVLKRGYSDLYEKEYVCKDGSILPVELRTYLLRDKNDAPMAMWAFIRDISERKQAEQAIRESEEKYRNLIDQSRDAIYLLHENKFEIINKRFEEMFGYTQEETNAPGFNFMNLISPKSHPVIEERSRKVDRGEEVSPQYEFTAVSRDGREIEVETSVSYVRYKEGIATQGVLRDITERVKAERALRNYAQELQRSNQELEHFAYISSHDLQEPLRMVASYLQLLQRRYADRLDSDAKEFIAYAVDGAVRMQTLINDLLTYSRVGTRGKSFQATDCEKVLATALLNLKVAVEEKNACIIHEPFPVIQADATQLVQVFQNLIGNAIKFCQQVRPEIVLKAERKDDEWLFSVRDNGIGFEEKYSERIFKIFQRLHTREEYAGTGAGLAICKRIVERHGGRIWAVSKPGQGSTFFFTIPDKGDLRDEQPENGQTY